MFRFSVKMLHIWFSSAAMNRWKATHCLPAQKHCQIRQRCRFLNCEAIAKLCVNGNLLVVITFARCQHVLNLLRPSVQHNYTSTEKRNGVVKVWNIDPWRSNSNEWLMLGELQADTSARHATNIISRRKRALANLQTSFISFVKSRLQFQNLR